MKRQVSTIGTIAALIFIFWAVVFMAAVAIALIDGTTTLYDVGMVWGLSGFAIAFLGMAHVSFSRLNDGIDRLLTVAVNGLFGVGGLFLLLALAGPFQHYPEKYEWGVGLAMGITGFFLAIMAPLLHNRFAKLAFPLKARRVKLSTAAILSIILFGNTLLAVLFHLWFLFFR